MIRVELGHGARALFTTRAGGVSEGPYASLNLGRTVPGGDEDDHAAIEANRDRVAAEVGIDRARFEAGHQVHGTRVRLVDRANGWPVGPLPHEGDGVATTQAGLAVLVLVADCLPIALAARDGGVAMVHAGWRGLAGGVVENAIAALGGAGGVGSVRGAAIGPGIGPCCFEVGDDVREAFAAYPEARKGRTLDLKAIARARLAAAGVGVGEIHDVERCTACEPEAFFSHRRDGGRTGRQAGVAWSEA